MAFHELVGNTQAKDLLLRGLAHERLPHALIFSGIEGVGKRQFALALAQAFNCQQRPNVGCGRCQVCTRISKGEHPDVQVIVPDGSFIKIAQVREILQKLSYEPFEGNRRVAIFDSAERMNANAANALLKLLEEPPPHASLVLVTSSPQGLLETIRSRCQMVRFSPLALTEMEQFLQANYRRPIEENLLLARISQGSPGRAAGADLSEFRAMRKEVLELVELLGRGTQRVRLIKAAGHFGKKERDEFETRLNLIATVLRDVMCCVTEAPQELVTNVDVLPRIKEISGYFTPARLADLLERFEQIRRDLVRNINRTMALESMFVEFIYQKV